MNDLVPQPGSSFLAASWLPEVLTVIGAIVAINVVAYYLLRHIEKLAARTPAVWDDALIRATRKPLTLILWVSAAAFAVQIVLKHSGTPCPSLSCTPATPSSSPRSPGFCCA